MREIGAFEAKNKFGQLLDWVGRYPAPPMPERQLG
jgi:hypothetical protein